MFFFHVCQDLLVVIFFYVFYVVYRLLAALYKKNIKPLTNDNKRRTNCE